jgi:hypothetical protein
MRGRKYQNDLLYLQSTNSIKHQLRRHLGFDVFVVYWSMAPGHAAPAGWRGRDRGHREHCAIPAWQAHGLNRGSSR